MRKINTVLAALILLCLSIGLGAVYTNTGLRVLLNCVPGELSFQQTSGNLAHQFTIQKLHYRFHDINLDIDHTNVDWNLWALLSGSVHAKAMTLSGVKLTLTSTNNKEAQKSHPHEFKLPTFSLPINFSVEKAELSKVTFIQNQNKWSIDSATFSGHTQNNKVHLNQLDIESNYGDMHSAGMINLTALLQSNFHFDILPTTTVANKLSLEIKQQQLHLTTEGLIAGKLEFGLNKQLSGNWDLKVKDASMLIPSIEGTMTSSGRIYGTAIKPRMDFHLSHQAVKAHGTLIIDTINKSIDLKAGETDIPAFGINLTNINADLSAKDPANVTLNGSVYSKKHALYFNGKRDFSQAGHPGELSIHGKNVTVYNTSEYIVAASPQLIALFDHNNIKINGEIHFPVLTITPKDFSGTVTLPSETIIEEEDNPQNKSKAPAMQIDTDIMAKSDNIHVNYHGLKANIAGNLQISHKPGTPTTAHGKLSIKNGSYQAYGRDLNIDTGSHLIFDESISDPIIAMTASKKIIMNNSADSDLPSYQHYLTVGIKASGHTSEPTITLFSEPVTYSQQDILSYLLFGFAQSDLNNAQSSLVWQAVNSLNTGKNSAANIKNSLQKTFGLDELGVTTSSEYNPETETEEVSTNLTIGKRINDKLSVTYSMGLVVPVNIFYVRYQLSKRWAIQSDSSTYGNGGDLLYSFSRN